MSMPWRYFCFDQAFLYLKNFTTGNWWDNGKARPKDCHWGVGEVCTQFVQCTRQNYAKRKQSFTHCLISFSWEHLSLGGEPHAFVTYWDDAHWLQKEGVSSDWAKISTWISLLDTHWLKVSAEQTSLGEAPSICQPSPAHFQLMNMCFHWLEPISLIGYQLQSAAATPISWFGMKREQTSSHG
jgi:hypothetical protein